MDGNLHDDLVFFFAQRFNLSDLPGILSSIYIYLVYMWISFSWYLALCHNFNSVDRTPPPCLDANFQISKKLEVLGEKKTPIIGYTIVIMLAIRQCAAWSSTLITHHFPERRITSETKGNSRTKSTSLLCQLSVCLLISLSLLLPSHNVLLLNPLLLILCLPSDNVHHEFQRWPFKIFVKEETPGTKGYTININI